VSELTPAPEGYPIKLVRDRTAKVINGSGKPGELFYGTLPEDVGPWLRRKLMEGATEYLIDPGVDELADVLAVVEGLAARHGLTLDSLYEIATSDKRGGFLTGQMMYGRHPEFDDEPARPGVSAHGDISE
jgi:predicted house-cleaning noncanonical NTP pyrophosphatase (MazG superfamily)